MAPDLSFLLSAGGYFKKNLLFFSITNCDCFKVCLEEFQISFSFICTHIEIKYFNEASLVNLQYHCFLGGGERREERGKKIWEVLR